MALDHGRESRDVQMCACYLTIQRTTLVGVFEIRFRTLRYEQLEARETLTLTLIDPRWVASSIHRSSADQPN